MSLAGPHGEAACRYCNTLQDLDETGRFRYHNTRGNRSACVGSKRWPEPGPKELESLAFNADPVQRHCPTCGQLVVINTMGATHRSGWRYQYHKAPQLRAAKSWGQPPSDCPQSGQLVTPRPTLNEDAVEIDIDNPF